MSATSAARSVRIKPTGKGIPNVNGNDAKAGTIEFVLASDHPLLRAGLKAIALDEPDLHLIDEPTTPVETLAALVQHSPHVLVLDVSLGRHLGFQKLRELTTTAGRQTAVLVLVSRADAFFAGLALEAGARGVVDVRESTDEILKAIRLLASGEIYLAQSLTSELLGFVRGSKVASPMQGLTEREFEVFELIGAGCNTKAIARQLVLSPHTVETYRERLRQKLVVANGTELTFRAIVWNLLNHG